MRVRATTGRVIAALPAVVAVAWLVGACGSGGASTAGKQAGQAVSTAVGNLTSDPTTTTSADAPPAKTTTSTETRTITEPAQTVTRTETTQTSTPTASTANKTTSVQVSPTSTTDKQTGDQIPWWGWVLIGLGAAAIGIGIFAAGHRRGARRSGGSPVSPGATPGPDQPGR